MDKQEINTKEHSMLNNYSVKNVKTFMGMDTHGFNASLYCENKKVADLIDDGSGGDMMIYWKDLDQPRVMVTTKNILGEEVKQRMTKQENAFFKQFKDHLEAITFLYRMIDNYENEKYLKRLCKNKTILELHSHNGEEFIAFSRKYSPEYAEWLRKKYGDDFKEIINERYL